MPARIRYQTFDLGGLDIHARTLWDTTEYADDDHEAEDLGIGSATWSTFGVVWESSRVLARLMVEYDIEGRRILEVGCGIGLASLVLNKRNADITTTDHHPEADGFLQVNAALNGGPAIPFLRTAWSDLDSVPPFDLVIGSDILYERGHAEALSTFIDEHARRRCEVIVVDPGRAQCGRFDKLMRGRGYTTGELAPADHDRAKPHDGRIMRHLRSH